jgi:type IV pilus assembly protein PilY1
MVFFGTGKYLEEKDNQTTGQPTHALYGIWDKDDGAVNTLSHTKILRQEIVNQYSKNTSTGTRAYTSNVVREVTQREIDWNIHQGWRLLLRPEKLSGFANLENFGERQISAPTLRKGRLYFTTFQPHSDSCGSIGRSFLMQIDYRNGGMSPLPVFDLNRDGAFDGADGIVAGMALGKGVLGEVSLIESELHLHALGAGRESGVLDTAIRPDSNLFGRQSWRQLE